MILQNLVLPQDPEAGKELYARSDDPYVGFPLMLRTGETVSFAAYFNYFSLSKWWRYTSVRDLHVFLKCEGVFGVTVDHHILVDGIETVHTLLSFESDGDADRGIPILPDTGMLSIAVTSLSDGSVLYGGGFRSASEPPNDIRIGVDICTYRREREVTDKAERICSFLGSSDKRFSDSIELYVIDNGDTLGDSLVSGKVHVIPNRNLGGSGGFAKGMMEISDSGRFTHVLLNDDDASFDPESLYRTWSFLSFLKEEYKGAQIGGAMMTTENPNTVYESGARYSERGTHSNKNGLDLAKGSDCLLFDREEEIDYFGWWYLTIPCTLVKEIGYPLPLFIKEDDIEYGIRKKNAAMITLNGISAWHGSFQSKFSASNDYYYARNRLVIGCTTGDLNRRDALWMLRNALFEAVCYRYGNAEMMLNGICDFLKGPEYVFGLCLDGTVSSVPIVTGRTEDLRKDAVFVDPETIGKKGPVTRMLTMNGLLLPPKRNVETSAGDMDSSDLYRAGKVLYDIDGNIGFVAERSMRKTLSLMLKAAGLSIRMIFSFKDLKKRYEGSLKKYSSEEHWRNMFDL